MFDPNIDLMLKLLGFGECLSLPDRVQNRLNASLGDLLGDGELWLRRLLAGSELWDAIVSTNNKWMVAATCAARLLCNRWRRWGKNSKD